ncbi:MAG: COX15/CtaA family protein [Hyphomicrobiaceae bacterium]
MPNRASNTTATLDLWDAGSTGPVANWLICVALLVIAMIAVGGATRLTDSGLSITEWKPILGVIPPISDDAWNLAFEKYKAIPEYREVNKGMDLAAFKTIYWWEWGHRFLGRIIGIAYVLPLLTFLALGMIPLSMRVRLSGLFVLGGLQGVIGWYMVQSGLTDRIDVSPYRLAMHLSLAFFILAILVWSIADLTQGRKHSDATSTPPGSRLLATVFLVLLFCQIVLGAFVAGTKAGLVYTTWPFMEGQLIPNGLWAAEPWYVSAFEDHLTIQFNHRVMAYALVIVAIIQYVRFAVCTGGTGHFSAGTVLGGTLCQFSLGVWTLVSVDGAIPIGLGVAHQTLAAFLLAASIWHLHVVQRESRVRSVPA